MKALYVLLAGCLLLQACHKNEDPAPATPVVQHDLRVIDSSVAAYMSAYRVPGAAIAISKNGKLVYSKAYGFADTAAGERTTTQHRFRLASISKTITAVAIMKLMQEGRLSLNDRVFGAGALLGTSYGTVPYSANVQALTVKHLLQHTSGGWRNTYPDDPSFNNPSFTADQLVSWTLDNRPLTAAPGTVFGYSNFGYVVLARIVAKVSGKPYDRYVKEEVLAPAGITDMELAGNTLADRKSGEVKYYGQGAEAPKVYTEFWNRNDGAFGWMSTAADLTRFLTAIDSSATRPDILTGPTLAVMQTPTSVATYYASGMYVDNVPVVGTEWYGQGSLPGTGTMFLRTQNGYCITILTNTRPALSQWQTDIGVLLEEIAKNGTIPWQNIDQF